MKQIRFLNLQSLIIIILFSIITNQTIHSQRKNSKKEIKEDLKILKKNLENLHAGLYTYSSKEEIDKWFKNLSKNLKDSITPFEFYSQLAPLSNIIKNGHTYINNPNIGDDFHFLPIQLYKYKKSFYIKKSFSKQHSDLAGIEILEIDGISIDKIYNRLIQNYNRDGDNLSMPSDKLSSLFGLEYSMVYNRKPAYNLTLKKDDKQFLISIQELLINEEVIKEFKKGKKKNKPLSFKIDDDIAILNFPTFDAKTLKKLNYKNLLEDSFTEIKTKNIEHLIIDVRNNGGGNTIPTQELISYLIDNEFILYKDVYTITKKIEDKKYYKKEGVFWLNLFSWLKVKKIRNQHYRRRNNEGMDVYLSKENNFKGQLYILTNGNSFSATGEFTSFIKHHRNKASFIGEEVGGNEFQNTSGISYKITLPNSNQKVRIPLVLFEMNIDSKNSNHGVKPNYWVRNTIEDELNSIDSAINFTIDLIKKSKINK